MFVDGIKLEAQAAALLEAGGKMAMRRPFDPAAHDLEQTFRLTKFADLKGWGCKVPQEVLLKLLEGLQEDGGAQGDSDQSHFQYVAAVPRIGELDSCHHDTSIPAHIFLESITPK